MQTTEMAGLPVIIMKDCRGWYLESFTEIQTCEKSSWKVLKLNKGHQMLHAILVY